MGHNLNIENGQASMMSVRWGRRRRDPRKRRVGDPQGHLLRRERLYPSPWRVYFRSWCPSEEEPTHNRVLPCFLRHFFGEAGVREVWRTSRGLSAWCSVGATNRRCGGKARRTAEYADRLRSRSGWPEWLAPSRRRMGSQKGARGTRNSPTGGPNGSNRSHGTRSV